MSEDDGTWGDAPPYGAYCGAYGSYELGQGGQLGSGILGGWSFVGWGGSFDAEPLTRRELKDELKRLARHQAGVDAQSAIGKPAKSSLDDYAQRIFEQLSQRA